MVAISSLTDSDSLLTEPKITPKKEQMELLQVHYPYTRWISHSCTTTYPKSRDKAGLIVGLCPSCSTEENVKENLKAEHREADNEFSDNDDWREPEFDGAAGNSNAVRVKKEAVDLDDFVVHSRRRQEKMAMGIKQGGNSIAKKST